MTHETWAATLNMANEICEAYRSLGLIETCNTSEVYKRAEKNCDKAKQALLDAIADNLK